MIDFDKLSFLALERMKKVVNNVNSFFIYFEFDVGSYLLSKIDVMRCDLDKRDKISYKVFKRFIKSEYFEDFLKSVRNEIEIIKSDYEDLEYNDLLLTGELRFVIDFSKDFYITIYDEIDVVFRKVPIRNKNDIMKVVPVNIGEKSYKIDNEIKKELIVLMV